MSNVLILNAHQSYPFSEGKLNQTLVDLAKTQLEASGHQVKLVKTEEEWDVAEQLENHRWADIVILQSPVNWMGVPWSFKKYMDDVYTAGMDGTLCSGDGRSQETPEKNYGTGGTLNNKSYMLSLTFNAPEAAFNNDDEYLFLGKSVDDLFFPMHMNFRFFGMQALETFAAFDVMKNPQISNDLQRLKNHLSRNIEAAVQVA